MAAALVDAAHSVDRHVLDEKLGLDQHRLGIRLRGRWRRWPRRWLAAVEVVGVDCRRCALQHLHDSCGWFATVCFPGFVIVGGLSSSLTSRLRWGLQPSQAPRRAAPQPTASSPPSTEMLLPETNVAFGLAANSTTRAMSSGTATRPSGV